MENYEKLISIIVPVFNTKKYLEQCLNSILNQKYMNIQVIVVDDGSTDGSDIICDKYAELDDRVEVLHIINRGSVGARKVGLNIARGEYIGFVDSDDYIDFDMFSSLVSVLEKTGADFVHSGYKKLKNNYCMECMNFERAIYDLTKEQSKIDFLSRFVLNINTGKTISYSMWSKLYKAELIKKCFEDLNNSQQLGEDAICLFKCIFESNKVAFEPITLYNYRIREESLSHFEHKGLFNKQVMLCGEILKVLEHHNCLHVLENDISNFLVSTLLTIKKNEKNRPYKLTQFYLENIEIFRGKSVALYGVGCVGEDICDQLIAEKINVVCAVDLNSNREQVNGIVIEKPSFLLQNLYDCILIAVFDKNVADGIREQLVEMGIVNSSIIWIKPKKYY